MGDERLAQMMLFARTASGSRRRVGSRASLHDLEAQDERRWC